MAKWIPMACVLAALGAPAMAADTPAALRDGYAREAGVAPGTVDAAEGEALFRGDGREGRRCESCHTADPRQAGRTRAGKAIAPMAPAVNPERFADRAKTEKWFGRNCKDVLGRECSAREKAALIAWLMSL